MFDIFNYLTLRDKFAVLAKIECLLGDVIRISFWKDHPSRKALGQVDKPGRIRLEDRRDVAQTEVTLKTQTVAVWGEVRLTGAGARTDHELTLNSQLRRNRIFC